MRRAGILLPALAVTACSVILGIEDVKGRPGVTATDPSSDGAGVASEGAIRATFSADMAPGSINASSFQVMLKGTPVLGTVSYDAASRVATFQPDHPLALLGFYTAHVAAGVTDVSGLTMGSEHVWSFTVRDGVWGAAELLERDDSSNAFEPRVVVDPSGNATTIWYQTVGGLAGIWASRWVAGTGWGPAVNISGTTTFSIGAHALAADRFGNVFAVWQVSDGTRGNIQGNRFSPTGNWAGVVSLESSNNDAANPRVAVDASGNAIAVWNQTDGTTNNDIYASRYVNGGTGWGPPALLEISAGNAALPQVAMDDAGNALAVWMQHDGTRFNVHFNRFAVATTTWIGAGMVENDNSGDAVNPRLAMTPSGVAFTVWRHTESRNNIWWNRFVPGSSWGLAGRLETDDMGNADGQALSVNAAGDAVAIWHQTDGQRNNITANRYVLGSGWQGALPVENENAGNAVTPSVGLDPQGHAVAVWAQNAGGSWDDGRANRLPAGGAWGGTPAFIETGAGMVRNARVAVDPWGNAFAVFEQSDATGARTDAWAATFR